MFSEIVSAGESILVPSSCHNPTDLDKNSNRTCSGTCKKHVVKKPVYKGRYESGQCRCQTCDVWLDYHGCHLKDQSPATPDRNIGWFCNCCNYRCGSI